MSVICGYRWDAPQMLAPGAPAEIITPTHTIPVHGDRVWAHQVCVEKPGHKGPHRSRAGVFRTNEGST